jgi:hypothetical protein
MEELTFTTPGLMSLEERHNWNQHKYVYKEEFIDRTQRVCKQANFILTKAAK